MLRRLKLGSYLSPCSKINLKCIKGFNVRLKLWNYYSKTGKTFEDVDKSNNFLNESSIAQEIRARIDKWDCIKLKSLSTTKEMVTRMKTQHTE
jgi:hypothetical protein